MPSNAFAISNIRIYLQIGPKTQTNHRFLITRQEARTEAQKEDVFGETRMYGNPITNPNLPVVVSKGMQMVKL